jgi:hypothetical protein
MFNIWFVSPKLVRDKVAGTNIKATIALGYYMRRHGVYFPELHALFLSNAPAGRPQGLPLWPWQ